MENELSNNMPQALNTNELENISGGCVVHSKDKEGKDIYYVTSDIIVSAPSFENRNKPHPALGKPYSVLAPSGPYYTQEEAVEAAEKNEFSKTDIVEWNNPKTGLEEFMENVKNLY